MSLKHLTPSDMEYYKSTVRANYDATTPGFIRALEMPYGFMHRLNMNDEQPCGTPERPKLYDIAKSLESDGPWDHHGYDLIAGPQGIVCEVRGIGRGKQEQLRNYLAAVSPERVVALFDALEALNARLKAEIAHKDTRIAELLDKIAWEAVGLDQP